MEGLGINAGYLAMQILLFAILFLVLKGYAYEPMTRILDERKARIAKGLEDARQAAIARDNADAEARKILDAARAEAAKIRADAAVAAEETASSITAEANRQAKEIIARAQEEAEAERNRILSELRGQVAAIAMAAASKLIGASLDERRQRELISEFFASVPDSVRGLRGRKGEVTSALELTDQERAKIRQTITAEEIAFKEDPGILGGLIIRVDDQIIDNSVAGQTGKLRESLL